MNTEMGPFTPVSFINDHNEHPPVVMISSRDYGHMGAYTGRGNVHAFLNDFGMGNYPVTFVDLINRLNVSPVLWNEIPEGVMMHADAAVSAIEGRALSLAVGDCYVTGLYDPKRNVLAAMHTGWKGLAGWRENTGSDDNLSDPLLFRVLKEMVSHYRVYPPDLRIFIGPGICADHYEVQWDVASLFWSQYPRSVWQEGDRFKLDLLGILLSQLEEVGVLGQGEVNDPSKITIDGRCTLEEESLFSSRNGDKDRFAVIFALPVSY